MSRVKGGNCTWGRDSHDKSSVEAKCRLLWVQSWSQASWAIISNFVYNLLINNFIFFIFKTHAKSNIASCLISITVHDASCSLL
jgi:hypothetical protein